MNIHELAHRFNYHPPKNKETIKAHEDVREEAMKFAAIVAALTPESREQAIALTKIEEAMMWANAAIARNPE